MQDPFLFRMPVWKGHEKQEMAHQGILSRRLAQCKIPSCSTCLYGKATKRAWRSKQGIQGQRQNPEAQRSHLC